MSNRLENIKNDLIEWAILCAGHKLDEFYTSNPKVKEWIDGVSQPTIKQLENFTQKVHVPFGYMFMDTPPKEKIPIPFFRTGKKNPMAQNIPLNVYHTIQLLLERQSWLTDYLSKSGYDDLGFVGRFNLETPLQIIVQDIKKKLGLDNEWASNFNSWEEALNQLTVRIEEIGIIVNFNGIVGNNTRRVIDPNECRGFVLVNKKAPFIFVNYRDGKAAQMFTIVHELAHIWLGETAGFDNKNLLPASHPIEIFSDKIAAEFLVPREYFIKEWQHSQDFSYLGKVFKVSRIVIARRALDLQLISRSEFFKYYTSYLVFLKLKYGDSKSSGGNFYATAKRRISLRFASYVNTAVKENKLLYRDAYKLTTLKGNTYDVFINEYLYQV